MLDLTAEELSVLGTVQGTGYRSGFSGADRWRPVYRRRRFVTLPTPDITVLCVSQFEVNVRTRTRLNKR